MMVADDACYSLAYAEMRLIIAKVLFTFDLELVDKERDWFKGQRVFTVWNKPSLMVKLTPVG
jgi:cytochrome P450